MCSPGNNDPKNPTRKHWLVILDCGSAKRKCTFRHCNTNVSLTFANSDIYFAWVYLRNKTLHSTEKHVLLQFFTIVWTCFLKTINQFLKTLNTKLKRNNFLSKLHNSLAKLKHCIQNLQSSVFWKTDSFSKTIHTDSRWISLA